MISQYEVPAYLEDMLPEMKEALAKKGVQDNVFDPDKAIECLTDFTIKSADAHNIKMLKRCFKTAEKLHAKGSGVIIKAIDKIFINSLSRIFSNCHSRLETIQIQLIMPAYVFSAYVEQLIKSKCSVSNSYTNINSSHEH